MLNTIIYKYISMTVIFFSKKIFKEMKIKNCRYYLNLSIATKF